MALAPVLAIDTSCDESCTVFALRRAALYDELADRYDIVHLGKQHASRRNVIDELHRRPYRAIVVSSHGAPSCVFDRLDSDKTLLSITTSPADLGLWARGHVLYFCSCHTAEGPLFERLKDLGATAVIGFKGEPGGRPGKVLNLWLEFDAAIVREIVENPGGGDIRAIASHYREMVQEKLNYLGNQSLIDAKLMIETLRTMHMPA